MRIGPAGGLSHSVLGGKTPVPNGKVMDVKPYSLTQWRRYVVKYGVRISQAKPSNCSRLHPTSTISKHWNCY